MRYVMVPVPSEHVREVIAMVLASVTNDGKNAVRDRSRLKLLLDDSDDRTVALLRVVANATAAGTSLSLSEASRALGQKEIAIRSTLRELDARVMGRVLRPVSLAARPASGPPSAAGSGPYLTMRPELADHVQHALRAVDAPGQVDAGTVSTTPRVLYIHVMKTGGTTLLQHLRKNIPPDELYPNLERDMSFDSSNRFTVRHLRLDYLRKLPEERRRRIRVYAAHFPYLAAEAIGGDLTTLTILRDPVDRTISLLRQWTRNRPEAMLSLEDVYELPGVFERLVHNHQTKIFSMRADDEPTGYMQPIDLDPTRLASAKEHLAQVDIVGLTERYDDFLDLVVERFGWDVDRGVHANASPAGELVASDQLVQRIVEDNALDVELFEYATELVDARRRARRA